MATTEREKAIAKELAAAKAALQAALAGAKAVGYGDVVGEIAEALSQVEHVQRAVS